MPRFAVWILCVISAGFAAAGGFFSVRAGDGFFSNAFAIVAGLVYPVAGAIVVSRQRIIGSLLVVAGMSESIALAGSGYAKYGLVTMPGSVPGPAGAGWLAEWAWTPGFAAIFVLTPIFFPDGRGPSKRWRLVPWAVGAAMAAIVVASVLTWSDRTAMVLGHDVPGSAAADAIGGGAFLVLLVCAALALIAVVVRFRRSRGIERQQLKWFVFAVALSAILMLTAQVVQIEEVLLLLAIPLLPAAIAISILRHRLYEIDFVINRSLVYGGLTAIIFGAYVGGVTIFDRFARRNDVAASLVTAVVVALLFQPLRDRIQRGINRLMFGLRDDPYAALSRLSRQLEASTPADVLPAVANAVAHALRLSYAGIEMPDDGAPAIVTATGTPAAEPERIPLTYQGQSVGALLVSPRSRGETLSTADRRVLDDLARQVGIAVYALNLTRDLQRSRERLVGAREEERRRLRRDLHDGLGPALAGVALEVEAARNVLRSDAQAADQMLGRLAEKIQDVVTEIRRLVYGLRPPALDELGLVAALREQATHVLGSSARIEAPIELPGLSAAVEVAAYRIATEAMTNVARHADARSAVVRLSISDDSLVLDVQDNGRGVTDDAMPGVGLRSMRERAEELGGTWSVGPSAGGGTRVLARLPLERS